MPNRRTYVIMFATVLLATMLGLFGSFAFAHADIPRHTQEADPRHTQEADLRHTQERSDVSIHEQSPMDSYADKSAENDGRASTEHAEDDANTISNVVTYALNAGLGDGTITALAAGELHVVEYLDGDGYVFARYLLSIRLSPKMANAVTNAINTPMT